MKRRKITTTCALVITCLVGSVSAIPTKPAISVSSANMRIEQQLSMLEKEANGRLGVYLIDTATGAHYSYRGDERFPFCSTSKVMAVAALLKQSEKKPALFTTHLKISQHDLVNYNPITSKHVGGSMSLAELSAATLQYSDNAAMNLLITQAGGIAAINRFAKSIGDTRFNLVRNEPTLNTALPNDYRDTTTPKAMAESLKNLTLSDALAPQQRAELIAWMKGNTTGDESIKAGLPSGWMVADKTGSGDYGTTNDIAVIWPSNRAPIVLVTYFTQFQQNAAARKDVLAKAASIMTAELH